MTKPVNPIRGNVAVAPIFEKDTYETSHASKLVLHKPDQYKGRCTQGIVKYIGLDVDSEIKVGDYVFFSAYTGTLWDFQGELLILFAAKHIKAKLEQYKDHKDIPGLYFKTRVTEQEIQNLIREAGDVDKETIVRMSIALARNSFFVATQDMVIDFLAQAQEPLKVNEIDPENPENFLEH